MSLSGVGLGYRRELAGLFAPESEMAFTEVIAENLRPDRLPPALAELAGRSTRSQLPVRIVRMRTWPAFLQTLSRSHRSGIGPLEHMVFEGSRRFAWIRRRGRSRSVDLRRGERVMRLEWIHPMTHWLMNVKETA